MLKGPTGTSAFGIDGLTLHSALLLSTRGSKALSADNLNTLRSRLGMLQLLIIDEVSMVGSDMLLSILTTCLSTMLSSLLDLLVVYRGLTFDSSDDTAVVVIDRQMTRGCRGSATTVTWAAICCEGLHLVAWVPQGQKWVDVPLMYKATMVLRLI